MTAWKDRSSQLYIHNLQITLLVLLWCNSDLSFPILSYRYLNGPKISWEIGGRRPWTPLLCLTVGIGFRMTWLLTEVRLNGRAPKDVVSVSTSRSRDGLETYQRLVSVSSRPKCPTSRSRLGLGPVRLGSRLGLDPKRLGSRGGSRTISSRGDVSCRRAQLNYNSPMKTSRPMPYSVGRVLGTVCLDGYCLINNVFILFVYSYSVPRKRLAVLFLMVSKLRNKCAVWPRKK